MTKLKEHFEIKLGFSLFTSDISPPGTCISDLLLSFKIMRVSQIKPRQRYRRLDICFPPFKINTDSFRLF